VTAGYGKPFSFTFSGLATLWARIEPETAPKSRRPTTTYSLNAHCRSHSVCSTRPIRSTTCDGFSSASRRFSRPLIRIARLSGNQGVDDLHQVATCTWIRVRLVLPAEHAPAVGQRRTEYDEGVAHLLLACQVPGGHLEPTGALLLDLTTLPPSASVLGGRCLGQRSYWPSACLVLSGSETGQDTILRPTSTNTARTPMRKSGADITVSVFLAPSASRLSVSRPQ